MTNDAPRSSTASSSTARRLRRSARPADTGRLYSGTRTTCATHTGISTGAVTVTTPRATIPIPITTRRDPTTRLTTPVVTIRPTTTRAATSLSIGNVTGR